MIKMNGVVGGKRKRSLEPPTDVDVNECSFQVDLYISRSWVPQILGEYGLGLVRVRFEKVKVFLRYFTCCLYLMICRFLTQQHLMPWFALRYYFKGLAKHVYFFSSSIRM
jgi:hypothetical protein